MKRTLSFLLTMVVAASAMAWAESGREPLPGSGAVVAGGSTTPTRPPTLREAAAAYRADVTPPHRDVARPAIAGTAAVVQAPGGRSFWRSPWPYVLIGGGAVAVVLIARSSDGY